MILDSLLVFVPSLIYGSLLIFLLFPGEINEKLFLKFCLGIVTGPALSSCLFFFWCMLLGPAHTGYSYLEWAICIGLALLLFLIPKGRRWSSPIAPPHRTDILLSVLPAILLVGLAALTLAAYKNYTFMFPHGTFDAYAIWNLKARFIFRDAAHWQNAFSPSLDWKFHADYPLMLSLNVARGWLQLGEETTRVPILLSGLFTFSLLGFSYSIMQVLRDGSQAAVHTLLLLAAPWLMFYATTLNAAIPTAYFYLAACAMLVLYFRDGHLNYLALAGLTGGLSAWTKNEGQVFLLSLTLVLLVFLDKKDGKACARRLLAYAAGLFLPALTLLIFKVTLAPPNDLFGNMQSGDLLSKLVDATRYISVLRTFSGLFIHLGEWHSPVFLAALLFLIVMGFKRHPSTKAILPAIAVIGLTFLGYVGVYILTPHPLDWHLKYSADRLLFHLFPTFMFIIFYSTNTPKEILMQLFIKKELKEQI